MEAETDKILLEAIRRRDNARQAVIDWMNVEAEKCHIRLNYEAPGWATYEAAEAQLAQAQRAWQKDRENES